MSVSSNESELRYRGKTSEESEAKEVLGKAVDDKPTTTTDSVDLRKTFWLTRIVFLRSLAFIYFVAFLISFDQNKELIGDNGLTPTKLYLTRIKERVDVDSNWKLYMKFPTLFWFLSSWDHLDYILDLTAICGMFLSAFVLFFGAANSVIMGLLWILYHTLVNVGQIWFSFGWESQLLETGFLAIWIVPFFSLCQSTVRPSNLAIYGYRWLITRIMLGAGLIKIRGDPCWKDFTCMNYFYETQPNPNPMSYYSHAAPATWHIFEVLGNHMVELICPFLTFIPLRWAALLNGFWQILFQIILISTGNLSFLNWLTVLPSIWFFDDKIWMGIFSQDTISKVIELEQDDKQKNSEKSKVRFGVSIIIGGMIAYLSIPIVQNLISPRQVMNTSFEPFRLVNTYGAFGHVTKERTEIIFEGTYATNPDDSNAVWLEYEFKCKPGNVKQMPCLISPYHYRLDWLMWFAAFQNYADNPWLLNLSAKMLNNDQIVDSLMLKNPFYGKDPPKYIRAKHYKYNFTKFGKSRAASGYWWTRKLIGNYLPVMDIKAIRKIVEQWQFGWKIESPTQ